MMKRGLLKILLVLFLIFIVIVLGFLFYFIYLNSQINKAVQLEKDYVYLNVKCWEFCPYKNYDVGRQLNWDCMLECSDINLKELKVKQDEVLVSLNEKSVFRGIKMARYNNIESKEMQHLMNSECLLEILEGDKSCIPDYLTLLKSESNSEFKEPIYSDVSVSLQNISCDDDELVVYVYLSEGIVDGIIIIMTSEGNARSVKKTNIVNGINKITITKDEARIDSFEDVGLGYFIGDDVTGLISQKSC